MASTCTQAASRACTAPAARRCASAALATVVVTTATGQEGVGVLCMAGVWHSIARTSSDTVDYQINSCWRSTYKR